MRVRKAKKRSPNLIVSQKHHVSATRVTRNQLTTLGNADCEAGNTSWVLHQIKIYSAAADYDANIPAGQPCLSETHAVNSV
jgi:hypothetical protein